MDYIPPEKAERWAPRLIIHGGAGNITKHNLAPESWAEYRANLVRIYRSTFALLQQGETALHAATHAATLFEDCELFNCGKGAVFTRDGTNELEASVMTSRGYDKRACAVVLLKHVKNPIKLAREMLVRGYAAECSTEQDPNVRLKGAQGHVCLGGETAEKLAEAWGLQIVDEDYFWTKKRWEEHRRGLGKSTSLPHRGTSLNDFDRGKQPNVADDSRAHEYLPQGTTGCVALDQFGTLCVATTTGGLTNKLPLRIGDTPTIGAGFWAEEWNDAPLERSIMSPFDFSATMKDLRGNAITLLGDCLPHVSDYGQVSSPHTSGSTSLKYYQGPSDAHAVAVSGTGNGDSFLKLSAGRTVGAIVRFSYPSLPPRSLASALNQIVGRGGEMQESAGPRWGTSGDGQGGMIGIELKKGTSEIAYDFNCGGMFRCWGDSHGHIRVGVFRDEEVVST